MLYTLTVRGLTILIILGEEYYFETHYAVFLTSRRTLSAFNSAIYDRLLLNTDRSTGLFATRTIPLTAESYVLPERQHYVI
jgi:hypothetical protein